VLNAVVSAVASLQVADALKILAGHAELVRARITTIDVWEGTVRQIAAPDRDPQCAACGRREFPALEETGRPLARLCGRNAVQISGDRSVDLEALRARLEPLGSVAANDFAVRFTVGAYSLTVFADGRAIVKGSDDPGVARSLYARYVG
jgi:adenylyltransferase/sulfurtransferase